MHVPCVWVDSTVMGPNSTVFGVPEPGVSEIEATALQVELLTLGRVEASFTLLSLIRSLKFSEFLEKFIVGLVVQEPKVGAAIFNQQMFRVV